MDELLSINEAAALLKVNSETLRRWDNEGKLVAIKVNDRGDRRYKESDILEFMKANPKLIQYAQILKHGDYSIAWDSEGFASMQGNFGVIAKIMVEKENFWAGFAFAVGGLTLFARVGLKDTLDNLPIEIIKKRISKNLVFNGDVYTFEFLGSSFHEIQNPEWWQGKYGKTLVPDLRIEANATHPVTVKNNAWRVILHFKSKASDGNWYTNQFGQKNKFTEYFVWIDSEELLKRALPNTVKTAEILAVDFGMKRFSETKDENGDRDITRINENNVAFFGGKWVKDSFLPDELMS
jgi:excisionase family DNA binding protein